MSFYYTTEIDLANELLIFEVRGEAREIGDVEDMIIKMIKCSHDKNLQNVVLDSRKLKVLCSNLDVTRLIISNQESGLFDGLKIARVISPQYNIQHVIGGLAESLSLPIKNFETRSEAMLWLLFDKH